MTLTNTIQQFAFAAYVQGATDAYRETRYGSSPSGAVMEVITSDAVNWVNAHFVTTDKATIHATAYKAAKLSTENRIYL